MVECAANIAKSDPYLQCGPSVGLKSQVKPLQAGMQVRQLERRLRCQDGPDKDFKLPRNSGRVMYKVERRILPCSRDDK